MDRTNGLGDAHESDGCVMGRKLSEGVRQSSGSALAYKGARW